MVIDGYGVKVELKRRTGPALLIFVKETPDQIKEENLDKISMNRPRYRAIYNIPNSAEADLTPDELDCILPKEVVSCTTGYFSGGARGVMEFFQVYQYLHLLNDYTDCKMCGLYNPFTSILPV